MTTLEGAREQRNLLLFAPARSGLRRVALSSILARLPVGTVALTLPLFALAQGHSAAVAGGGIACYRVAQALVSPIWGRVADQRRLTAIYLVSGVAFCCLDLVLSMTGRDALTFLVLALALGLCTIPHTALIRAFWARQPDLVDFQLAASSFESFLSEGILLLGRLVVAAMFLVLSAHTLIQAQAALAVAGSFALATAPRMMHDQRPPTTSPGTHKRVTALFYSGRTLACFFVLSASLGCFAVAVTVRLNSVADAGTWTALAVGAWGLGSLVGIAQIRTRLTERFAGWFVRLAAAMGVAQLLVATTDVPWLTVILAFLAGLPIAACAVCLYGLLDQHRVKGRHTEQLAWATTAIFIGDAFGGAVAGFVAGGSLVPVLPLVCSAILAFLACLAVVLLSRTPNYTPGDATEA